MGNCGSREFIEHQVNEKNKTELNKINLKHFEKDSIIQFLTDEMKIGSLIKDITHLRSNYRIKKNIKCQSDVFYRIKVLEHTRSGRLYNVKILRRSEIEEIGVAKFKSFFSNEIKALKNFHHPNIEYLVCVYWEKTKNDLKIYLVTNYTLKYSLLDIINDFIKNKKRFSESQICILLKTLIELSFIFKSQNFIYRNFSPENIFFFKENKFETLCLRNFYFSTFTETNVKVRGLSGPLNYMAPEMLADQIYDTKVDIWSIGMIGYVLLTLEHPMVEFSNREALTEAIKADKCFKKEKELIKLDLYKDALNIIFKFLIENKEMRLTPENALEEKFFREISQKYFSVLKNKKILCMDKAYEKDVAVLAQKINNLKKFHNVIYYLVFNLRNYLIDVEEFIQYNELFKLFDKNNDNSVTAGEIQDGLLESNFTTDEVNQYLSILNTVTSTEFKLKYLQMDAKVDEHSPFYDYEFFVTSNHIIQMYLDREEDYINNRIVELFHELDEDKSGDICLSEIENFFVNKKEKTGYLTDFMSKILSDEYFDKNEVKNIEKMDINDLKKFFFYGCVKLHKAKDQIQIKK